MRRKDALVGAMIVATKTVAVIILSVSIILGLGCLAYWITGSGFVGGIVGILAFFWLGITAFCYDELK